MLDFDWLNPPPPVFYANEMDFDWLRKNGLVYK